jgi:hypothetical protein
MRQIFKLSFEGEKVQAILLFHEEETKTPFMRGFSFPQKNGSPLKGSHTVHQSQLQEF